MAEGENLQQELKKKKKQNCLHTLLNIISPNSQIHDKSQGLLTSKLDLTIFRIWCWRILLWATNQICFASATLVGIYTCIMDWEPNLPPGDCHETSWDCSHSLLPLPFNHRRPQSCIHLQGQRPMLEFSLCHQVPWTAFAKLLLASHTAGSELPLQKASHTKGYQLKGAPFLHMLSKGPLGFK